MVYKFRIISDEVDDFLREIKIDSEASFYDLHEAILKCTGYKDDQMTSLFICDDDWKKKLKLLWKIWVTEALKKILSL